MTGNTTERRLLQLSVALAGLVPVSAGFTGVVQGLGGPGAFVDSHYRYLSGLLLALGAVAWSCIPKIEQRGDRLRLVTLVVVIGGAARLGAALSSGMDRTIVFALIMELCVTPGLYLWQRRLQTHWRAQGASNSAL